MGCLCITWTCIHLNFKLSNQTWLMARQCWLLKINYDISAVYCQILFFFLPRKHWWNIGETKVTTEKSVSKFRIAWAVVLRSFDMATGKTVWHLKEKVCSSAKSLYEWVANFLAIFSNGYLISGFNNTHTDILYKYTRHLNSKRSPQFGLSDLAQFHFLLHHSILNHI